MDMAMRSFLLAGVLALIVAAGLAGWWFFGRDAAPDDDDPFLRGDYERVEGSLMDEFGEADTRPGRDDIRITIGQGLAGSQSGRSAMDSPPQFAGAADEAEPWWRSGGAPRVPETDPRLSAPLPRGTAQERVEADCRYRGGRSWACRCLVRVARARLDTAQFEFLSLAEEPEARPERLRRAGVEARALPDLSAALVGVHVEAGRRCGAGLTP
ncbi:MAG: hypothetical protein LAT81_11130 [Oceanicaulis sp.]|nr:hypothetical protein [Oceanicaulis sp.]